VLAPMARLSDRARRSEVGGSTFIDVDFVDAWLALLSEDGRLDIWEDA